MVWLEIETKVAIPKEEVSKVRKRILKIARFEKKESRGDDYFAIQEKGYPKKAFRIRKKGDIYQVNFKKWLTNLWTKEVVVKQEFEFKIKNENVKPFLALMEDHGFKEWMKKRKNSESYIYKEDKRVVIEINKVAHLGYFMEIEYLAQKSEVERARKKIIKVLEKLEIPLEWIDNTGYTKMLWYKGVKDRKYFID